jgi:hypothetical protein
VKEYILVVVIFEVSYCNITKEFDFGKKIKLGIFALNSWTVCLYLIRVPLLGLTAGEKLYCT